MERLKGNVGHEQGYEQKRMYFKGKQKSAVDSKKKNMRGH